MSACTAALESGNFRFYEPKYFGLSSRNPTNGVDRVVVPLESNLCIEMLVVGGRRFVVQREGTKFRAYKLPNGSLALYARDDCGNPVFGVIFPGAAPHSIVEPIRETPMLVLPPPPEPAMTPLVIPAQPTREQNSDSSWGITASAMVGAFDSVPIGGTIQSIAGRTVCIKGRGFDFGVARGGQESSLWRFTLASTAITEGSFTRYACNNCTQNVTTTAQSGVRTFGARLERVQGFNNEQWRTVRPMISAHIGAGRISGKAHQRVVRGGITTAMHAVVDASELFATSWVPISGVGVGIMGDIGKHLTYSVVVAGIEYPGVYYGRVTLTVWP